MSTLPVVTSIKKKQNRFYIWIIRIYEEKQIMVMLVKIHTAISDISKTVLGYLYESDKQLTNLFDLLKRRILTSYKN